MSIRERPGKPTTAAGELAITKGTYDAYGQLLKIDPGRISYAGGPIDNPGFDITAYRDITEYNVRSGLRVQGTARQPQISVFSDPATRVHLEEIVHPRVYARMKQLLDGLDAPYAIVVVPLLIETAGRELVDRVLVVDATEEVQIDRTNRRDGTNSAIVEKILAAQLDRGSRLSAADDVIENNASEAALQEAVSRLDRQYRAEAARIASERPKMKE